MILGRWGNGRAGLACAALVVAVSPRVSGGFEMPGIRASGLIFGAAIADERPTQINDRRYHSDGDHDGSSAPSGLQAPPPPPAPSSAEPSAGPGAPPSPVAGTGANWNPAVVQSTATPTAPSSPDGDPDLQPDQPRHNQSGGASGKHDHVAHHEVTKALSPQQLMVLKTQLAAPVAAAAGGSNHEPGGHPPGTYDTNQVIAVGMDQTSLDVARSLGFQVGYSTGDDTGFFPVTRLVVPEGADTLTALRTLKVALPSQVVALNSIYRLYSRASGKDIPAETSGTPGSCTADQCRPWSVIGWKDYLRGCSRGLAIGMIDTGLDTSHPALASGAAGERIVTEDFRLPGKKPAPSTHGTAVAALLMGDAGQGMAGLVPDAKLYAANAFYSDGEQSVTDTVSLLKALDWMRRHGVRIVNMSFAGPDDPLLAAAIRQSVREGMIIVAAAGNEGADAPPAFPAAYPGVIAVTAVGVDLRPYQRANHGAYIALSAPGVHIWTAGANGKGAFESGTSFAAPYVTAVAATILRSAGPDASAGDLLRSIPVKDLSGTGWSPIFGKGLAMAPANCGGVQTAEKLPWTWGPSIVSPSGLLGFTPASGDAGQ